MTSSVMKNQYWRNVSDHCAPQRKTEDEIAVQAVDGRLSLESGIQNDSPVNQESELYLT